MTPDRISRLNSSVVNVEADAVAERSAKAPAIVIVATRHEIIAAGIETILRAAGHRVLARCSCEDELVRSLELCRADIVIVADDIVGRDVKSVISRMRARNCSTATIFLLDGRDMITASDLVELDVAGILLSRACATSFIDCVGSVLVLTNIGQWSAPCRRGSRG